MSFKPMEFCEGRYGFAPVWCRFHFFFIFDTSRILFEEHLLSHKQGYQMNISTKRQNVLKMPEKAQTFF